MKCYLLLLIGLLGWHINTVQAQTDQVVLVEVFGNTYCPPCIFGEPDFYDQILDPYEDKGVLHIAYHGPSPVAEDVFFQHNPEEMMERRSYYGVNGVPFIYVQGKRVETDTALLNVNDLTPALNQKIGIAVDVTEIEDGDKRNVTVSLKTVDVKETGDLVVRVAVVEKDFFYTPPHEGMLTHHRNVFRKALNNWEGKTFLAPPAGISTKYTYSYDLNPEWNREEVYVIAFVQDENTKAVLNAGSSWGQITIKEDDPKEDTTTGLEEDDLWDLAWLYPNPIENQLQIRTKAAQGISQIRIFDVSGKEILQQTFPISSEQNYMVSVNDLLSGIYFVYIEIAGQWVAKRIVKQ